MKLKTILFSIVILTALFLSAFGSPASPQSVRLQNTVQPTVQPPAVTLVPPTIVVVTTPGGVPVTGGGNGLGIWTIILFGLLAILAIAFLVALFSPRTIINDYTDRDRNQPPPPPPEV